MSDSNVKCPNCGTAIDVEDILTHQLEDELKKKYFSEFAEKNKEVEKKREELQKLQQEFEDNKKKENELFREKLEKQLRLAKEEQSEQIKKRLREEQEDRMKLMNKELEEKTEKLKELHKSQAEIAKLKREKEELNDKVKAEAERKLNEQLREEKEKIKKLAEEENKLKLAQLQKQLDDQKKLTEDMKRKQEQGSMQLQGEVQELLIEDELQRLFPFDRVTEVSKGIRGADCIQTVVNELQQECGKIIYESKRTQNFAGDWIPKLKADMLAAGADVAVLVTQTLPKDQKSFSLIDGVWVCSFSEYKSLAAVLRDGVKKLHGAQQSGENKEEKMHLLYNYLTGNEFKHQIQAIMDAFQSLEEDLSKEKRLMMKHWSKREKEIQKVLLNTSGLYGSVQAIAGSSVPKIDALEFDDEDNYLEEGDDD